MSVGNAAEAKARGGRSKNAKQQQHSDDGPAAKITNLQPWSQSVNPGTNGPPASTTSPRPLSFLRPLPPRPAAVPPSG